jgi:hypothetical protein
MNGELVWIDHDALAKLGNKPLFRARREINGLVHKKILTNPDVVSDIKMVDGEMVMGQVPDDGTYVLVAIDRGGPKLKAVE